MLHLSVMACTPAISYRPRDPRASPLYQLIEEHLEELRSVYDERFAPTYGPWQEYWTTVIENFRRCGDLHYGVARVYCRTCRHTFLTAFSCDRRTFCCSCEAKRRALWVEHVLSEVLPPACSHRMLVFTVPKCLRGVLMRNRPLLGVLSRIAYEVTRRFLARQLPGVNGLPYFVSSVQLWGAALNVHPHLHALVSLAIKERGGALHHLPERLDFAPLADEFRRAVLAAFRRREVISEELAQKVLGWDHTGGFSVDASVWVPPGDAAGLERVAAYVLRPPVSLTRLTYQSGADTVIYNTPHTPITGGTFITMDAKEFIVRLLCLVAKPYETLIRYYGAASSTWRRRSTDTPVITETETDQAVPPDPPPSGGQRSSWARMIGRVYGVDPLTCSRCGSTMEIIAFITDGEVVQRILKHLNRWDPPRRPSVTPASGQRTIIFDEDLPVYEEIDEPP
jgi:hypothetical protein